MNKITNHAVMCEVLMEHAEKDSNIVVLCSDSRGSASLTQFASAFPKQFVEVGIAEQNLVGIAAGLAKCGKKAFAVSPSCFLSTRSYEQIKVDCAYSDTNVKLIGISGGVSYGALGMTHHSAQDIAVMASIPNMRVYLPSDRFQTKLIYEHLIADTKPAFVRLGRNPVEDVYTEENIPFEMNHATWICRGNDVALIACGEMVSEAVKAARLLAGKGISCTVLDMYCLKPLDREAILAASKNARLVVTVEEHSPFGGLGSMACSVISDICPRRVIQMTLPDEPVVSGTNHEVFAHYGIDANGIAATIMENL